MRHIDTIVLHHTGPPSTPTTSTAAIRRYHVEERGYQDVGYHWLVGLLADGHPRVDGGRPWEEPGAHCPPVQARSIGVAVCGDWSTLEPADYPALWGQVIRHLADLCQRHGVAVERLLGHREAQPHHTECPGTHVDMDDIRRRVAIHLEPT